MQAPASAEGTGHVEWHCATMHGARQSRSVLIHLIAAIIFLLCCLLHYLFLLGGNVVCASSPPCSLSAANACTQSHLTRAFNMGV
jgi:hypothetical protein